MPNTRLYLDDCYNRDSIEWLIGFISALDQFADKGNECTKDGLIDNIEIVICLIELNFTHNVHPFHDDVIKWKHFPHHWPFVRGIHQSQVNSPHKRQCRGALMFYLICARIKGWVNNREAGNLRRHSTHYDVTVMFREWVVFTATCIT